MNLLIFFVSVIAGALHYFYVSSLHENDLFYSHLSSRERELTFRTESGFYYSFFKQLITARTWLTGWYSLIHDARTEVPRCLNASGAVDSNAQCPHLNSMQRFNLYPELILATIYRVLWSHGALSLECYRVQRDVPSRPIALAVNPHTFQEAVRNSSVPMLASHALGLADTSVTSCVGLAEPSYFYITCVFVLAGLIPFALTWSGWFIASIEWPSSFPSSSIGSLFFPIWGLVLPVVAYFFNHREATRVQWIQPLRENFAYPFFTMQQAWMLRLLIRPIPSAVSRLDVAVYFFLLLGFQLPWQFAQFALATQVASLFAAVCIITLLCSSAFSLQLLRRVRTIVWVHLFALLANFILQFGNRLLLSSGYPAGLAGTFFGLWILTKQLNRNPDSEQTVAGETSLVRVFGAPVSTWRFILSPLLATVAFTLCPGLLLTRLFFPTSEDVHDGGHIVDLLHEKFQLGRGFRTFHTRLYTCAAEFDFIGWKALEQLVSTGLLPMSLLCSFWVLGSVCYHILFPRAKGDYSCDRYSQRSEASSRAHVDFVSIFIVLQLSYFSLMALLVMRLKLFWTPHLCLSLAILAQPRRWGPLFSTMRRCLRMDSRGKSRVHAYPDWLVHSLLAFLLAYMSASGTKNIQAELAIRGQFSAYNDEVLHDWFRSLSPPAPQSSQKPWVISGPMSTMGSLRLMLPASPPYPTTQPNSESIANSVGFAFTNHPHYESAELRKRTILAYSIYSRKSVEDIWHIYRHLLQSDFVIMDAHSCLPRHGCSNPELYDLIEPHLTGRPALCEALLDSEVINSGATPTGWKRYFDVVYVDLITGQVVLYVKRTENF